MPMGAREETARQLQERYYASTAEGYDAAHVHENDAHFVALDYICGLAVALRATSVLDVGSGTGRAVAFLRARQPELLVVGVEPVRELVAHSPRESGGHYVCGSGTRLPFPDASFDIVCATALMHHVPRPETVLAEMTRVARRAVMISDSNRFGQGRLWARLLKLALWRGGLAPVYTFARTRGRGYLYSEGDGVFYSYSVFDSAPALATWADRTFVIPTATGRAGTDAHSGPPPFLSVPALSAPHALLVSVRDTLPAEPWDATRAAPAAERTTPLVPAPATGADTPMRPGTPRPTSITKSDIKLL